MIMAPAAPMAPAWVTVATPRMIEPSTMKISASGGTSVRTMEIAIRRSSLRSIRTAGAIFGRISATTRMKSM